MTGTIVLSGAASLRIYTEIEVGRHGCAAIWSSTSETNISRDTISMLLVK
jgi:hypothetical protein